MTVRETIDFLGWCFGVGTRYEILVELSRREKESGIKPDPEINAFMKATAMAGQETRLITYYVLKILGLDICGDTMVGDDMGRVIFGGLKIHVTIGEMLVGPAKAFFMDEISTGLNSFTMFQIVRFIRPMVHIMDVTIVISLLQPAPETFELFDDIILLSEGQIVYQDPRENILEFFQHMSFKCPDRKGIVDFLQEVTSKKDQGQYASKRINLINISWCLSLYRPSALFMLANNFLKMLESPMINPNPILLLWRKKSMVSPIWNSSRHASQGNGC